MWDVINRVAIWCKYIHNTLVQLSNTRFHFNGMTLRLYMNAACYFLLPFFLLFKKRIEGWSPPPRLTLIYHSVAFATRESSRSNSLLPLLSPAIQTAYRHRTAGQSLAGRLFCTKRETWRGCGGPDKRTGARMCLSLRHTLSGRRSEKQWEQEGEGRSSVVEAER